MRSRNKLATSWLKKKAKRQTVFKTQYRKLKTYQHEPHQHLMVIPGVQEGVIISWSICVTCQVTYVTSKPSDKFHSFSYILEKGKEWKLRQLEGIPAFLSNEYSKMTNQLVMASLNLSKG